VPDSGQPPPPRARAQCCFSTARALPGPPFLFFVPMRSPIHAHTAKLPLPPFILMLQVQTSMEPQRADEAPLERLLQYDALPQSHYIGSEQPHPTKPLYIFFSCIAAAAHAWAPEQALRTIDKKGGLDNYLADTSDKKLASKLGSHLKLLVLEQRVRLAQGLPPLPPPKSSDLAYEERKQARVAKWNEEHMFDQ